MSFFVSRFIIALLCGLAVVHAQRDAQNCFSLPPDSVRTVILDYRHHISVQLGQGHSDSLSAWFSAAQKIANASGWDAFSLEEFFTFQLLEPFALDSSLKPLVEKRSAIPNSVHDPLEIYLSRDFLQMLPRRKAARDADSSLDEAARRFAYLGDLTHACALDLDRSPACARGETLADELLHDYPADPRTAPLRRPIPMAATEPRLRGGGGFDAHVGSSLWMPGGEAGYWLGFQVGAGHQGEGWYWGGFLRFSRRELPRAVEAQGNAWPAGAAMDFGQIGMDYSRELLDNWLWRASAYGTVAWGYLGLSPYDREERGLPDNIVWLEVPSLEGGLRLEYKYFTGYADKFNSSSYMGPRLAVGYAWQDMGKVGWGPRNGFRIGLDWVSVFEAIAEGGHE